MGLPRSEYVQEDKVGVYHCTTRCVRRAFLAGFDSHTGRDFSHRKQWIEDRLQFLVSIFSVEVTTFSVMSNHYHVTLRIRPDIVETWSDREIASRWLTLCPKRYRSKKKPIEPIEEQVRNLALCTERIAELRKRLGSLSWFMRCLNEFIARAANKEDRVKGRFWESRFKCLALLDFAAIAGGMVYVDLNPIRAGIAQTPEDSDFTGIQQRIRIWKQKTSSTNRESLSSSWLCPISSKDDSLSILPMSEEEYFILVDKSGRLLRSDKRGVIDADLAPILERIGAKPDAWSETISCFEDKFHLAAGLLDNLRKFADQLGKRWFAGLSASRRVFEPLKS
ncbi:MAG: transposase [Acidobacteria bacterium]|nr:transposase [Acidobacteriota bacterium]